MLRGVIFLFLFCCSVHAGQDYTVRIQQTSKSGKTLFLDKGKVDEIKFGDYGLLVQKIEMPGPRFVFKPVAKLKLLKLYDAQSIWVAYQVFLPELIQRNEKLMLFSESAMLSGRKQLSITRTSLVTNKSVNEEVRDFMLEGDVLAKKESSYQVIEKAHVAEKHYNSDVELVDINKWEKRLGDDKLFVSGIYKSPHAKEFSQRKRVQSFEKMANAFLNKYNDPGFNYKEFYKDQKRDNLGYMSHNPMKESQAQLQLKEQEDQKRKDEKLLTSLQEDGAGWSSAYSDEELRSVLTKLSVAKEKQRRKGIISRKFSYQFFAGGGINFINNENLNDSKTSEQSKIDFETSVESYLFQVFENFQKISFELSGRRDQDAFFGKDLNVKITEFSLAAHINFYPFYNPNVINQHIIYFGVLYRYGFASLSNETTDEVGNFRLLSFPGFRVSMKYNFENGYGFRIHGGFENINVERIEATDVSSNLPDRGNYLQGKLNVSLSKLF